MMDNEIKLIGACFHTPKKQLDRYQTCSTEILTYIELGIGLVTIDYCCSKNNIMLS